ncbi:MAG: hypothetical protein WAO10_16915 [Candidatus Sulfotelmatobacter sp.]
MRTQSLAIFLISVCFLGGVSMSASPVAVRYKEGLVHGFLVLGTLDGNPIAEGDLAQVARGNRVTSQLLFRFKDGSRQEETTVFSQRGNFRLISYHLVQKGPAFKHAMDELVTASTGQVTVRYTDDDGKQKVENAHLKLPPDLANGLVPTLLKNLPPGATQAEFSMLVAAPKPRVVKLMITADGTEPFSLVGSGREGSRYAVKVDIGGLAGVIAPILGKQPPDSHVWILRGEAPAFLKSETMFYIGGPMWLVELASPVWPRTSTSDAKKEEAVKR